MPADMAGYRYTQTMDEMTDLMLAATRAAAAVHRQQGRVATLNVGAGRKPAAYEAAVRRLGVLVDRHAAAVRAAVSATRG